MVLPRPDPFPAVLADLYAAAALLARVSAALQQAERPILAHTSGEMEAMVRAWTALLRAQHDRLTAPPSSK